MMKTYHDNACLNTSQEVTLILVQAQIEYVLERSHQDCDINIWMLRIAEMRLARIVAELIDE